VRVHYPQFDDDTSVYECTECGSLYDVLEAVEDNERRKDGRRNK